jgi:hypothetical protein
LWVWRELWLSQRPISFLKINMGSFWFHCMLQWPSTIGINHGSRVFKRAL